MLKKLAQVIGWNVVQEAGGGFVMHANSQNIMVVFLLGRAEQTQKWKMKAVQASY